MNNSQRASETQSINSLKQSIQSIRQEMNPIPTVYSTSSNPRAKPVTKVKWFRRAVRLTTSTNSLSTGLISYVDIGNALGALGSEIYTVKVLGVTAWNITNQATSSNSLSLALSASATSSGALNIIGEDYGNSSRLPGVRINIPDLISTTNLTSSSSNFCQVTAPLAGSTLQNFVIDFDLVMQI